MLVRNSKILGFGEYEIRENEDRNEASKDQVFLVMMNPHLLSIVRSNFNFERVVDKSIEDELRVRLMR